MLYRTDQDVREVAERFESCSYALHEFTHARHITVAVLYLYDFGLEAAMTKMRESLHRFSAHHGKMGYNETITRFWLVLVRHYLQASRQQKSLAVLANEAVERFADKNLLFRHYTRQRALVDEAKRDWVEPDLLPLASYGIKITIPD